MRKNIKWLLTEIDHWLDEGLVAADQAENTKRRYQIMDQGKAWGRIIFFSIGAVLFGLGIIFLFAYNWERMHKFTKLAVIVLALLSVHGSALWLRRPGGRYRSAGEGLHLAGTMLFGAGIWLVAQIYHINEHYPNAFLIWGCGALAMAWALPSISHAITAAILLLLWNSFEAFDFKNPQQWSPFIILAGLVPMGWIYRSRALLATTISAYMVMLSFCVASVSGDLAFLTVFLSACILIAAGMIVRCSGNFPESGSIFSFIGYLVYLGTLFVLSFYHRGKGMFTVDFENVLVLQPAEEKAVEFDFSDPRWWVKTETAQPVEIGTLEWNEQFRMIYRPPDQTATSHLKDRDIVWHGYLPSRAFHGRGRID